MPSKILSATVSGLDAKLIEVEVDVSSGLHSFNIVGLPDTAVQESKERVGYAIKNSGLKPPRHQNQKVIINLAPADIKKHGPSYDLPIALGYLVSSGQIKNFNTDDKIFVGELSLDGFLRPTNGILPIAIFAKETGKTLFLPSQNLKEANLVSGLKITPVENLQELIDHLEETKIKDVLIGSGIDQKELNRDFDLDMENIQGARNRQARAGDISRRRSQYIDVGRARRRQDASRQNSSFHPPAACRKRNSGNHQNIQHCRMFIGKSAVCFLSPVSQSASFRFRYRPLRRRNKSQARRDKPSASRRFISRRISGISPIGIRNFAPAAGIGRNSNIARPKFYNFSGKIYAGLRPKSLPLRIL